MWIIVVLFAAALTVMRGGALWTTGNLAALLTSAVVLGLVALGQSTAPEPGELRCRVGDLRARPQPMGPGAWGRWIRWWSVAGLSTSSGGSVTRLRLPVRTRLHVGLIFGFEGEPVPIVGSVGRRFLIGEVEAGLVLEPVHAGSGEGRR